MADNAPGQQIQSDTPITTIIRQQPESASVDRYEAWLKEIIPIAQTFAGHQSVSVIRPHASTEPYTIVLHFDSLANLRKWLDSDVRMRLVEKIRPYLRAPESLDIKTGFEFWFTPQTAGKAAKPYKQFLATLSAIFPLTVIVPWALQPLFSWAPAVAAPGIRHFIIAAIIVAMMVYVVMPRYTRMISRWLFR